MTSVSEPPSQPESLDLDYDMWQGQFEFVGNNNNNNNNINNIKLNDNNKNSSQNHNNNNIKNYDSLEDLNFMTTSQDFSKHPILIDDETFLSLNPNDFDDTNNNSNNNSLISGPNSTIFIDNKLNDNNNINNNDLITAATLTTVPTTVIQFDLNEKNCLLNNKENSLNNKLISKQLNNLNNNNCYKIENIKNYKNKLICGDFTDKLTNSHQIQQPLLLDTTMQQSGKLNGGITAEICDNLNEQLELLQRQVTDLTDSQSTVEDRTTRTKTEYAVLQARYHMLEEQYRESELRAEERLAEEQKRNRDLLARIEREAELQNENCQIKIRTIEIEANTLREEAQRLRILCDKQSNDLHATEEKLELARDSIMNLTQDLEEAQLKEKKLIDDKQIQEDLMIELSHELEKLRSEIGTPAMPTTSPETLRLEELHMEMDELRKKNKLLEEQNEELQAAVLTRGVEEGRHLLNGTLNSLAQELEEMSQTQDSVDSATLASLSQLQQAFQDKEDENLRLKTYIDTILLNIVENYPQLLEVKPPTMPNENSKIPKLKKKLSN